MLYGDDDTLFFVDGIIDLLKDFDPEMPYFISGALFTSCCHAQHNVVHRSFLVVPSTQHAHPSTK